MSGSFAASQRARLSLNAPPRPVSTRRQSRSLHERRWHSVVVRSRLGCRASICPASCQCLPAIRDNENAPSPSSLTGLFIARVWKSAVCSLRSCPSRSVPSVVGATSLVPDDHSERRGGIYVCDVCNSFATLEVRLSAECDATRLSSFPLAHTHHLSKDPTYGSVGSRNSILHHSANSCSFKKTTALQDGAGSTSRTVPASCTLDHRHVAYRSHTFKTAFAYPRAGASGVAITQDAFTPAFKWPKRVSVQVPSAASRLPNLTCPHTLNSTGQLSSTADNGTARDGFDGWGFDRNGLAARAYSKHHRNLNDEIEPDFRLAPNGNVERDHFCCGLKCTCWNSIPEWTADTCVGCGTKFEDGDPTRDAAGSQIGLCKACDDYVAVDATGFVKLPVWERPGLLGLAEMIARIEEEGVSQLKTLCGDALIGREHSICAKVSAKNTTNSSRYYDIANPFITSR
ncbi:hypothetical protein CERZMDRAFT_86031 [Cercospora zeae-maydis SCOH1-5]|uniref:Uncharacterized protein n=1 Tax=Cercospora zeae-maydis SCOH1-5 TaxID=717836 RepID=A0A6A6FBG8_9PEZI|nr:hypothetical protein CERZMDRAFT_86031 [Cercospora zeae-maydis SCOH1-5]